MTVRIFLVDDHEMVRRAIRFLLIGEDDFEVVGEAASVAEAVQRMSQLAPDVAILDVRLPDGSGAELCGMLKAEDPSLICVMLTSVDDAEARAVARAAGASDFILKRIRGTELVDSVRRLTNAGIAGK